MKLEALDHPKTLDLSSRLGVELPTAIGYLELLWAFAAKKSPQGDIGKWPDGAIARACFWNTDPTVFVTALTSAGFLNRHPKHRFVVHDWQDHAPRWVLAKLSRARLDIYDCSGDYSGDCSPNQNDLSGDCSQDCSGDSVREGKGREGKGSAEGGAIAPHPPPKTRAGKPKGNGKQRQTPLPADFALSEALRAYAQEHLPDADVPALFEKFREQATAKCWTYADWPKAWQVYVRNARKNSGHWAAGQYPKLTTAGGWV